MLSNLRKLFPSKSSVWILSMLLMAIFFLLYYNYGYPLINGVLLWQSEIEMDDPNDPVRITVLAPKFLADFDDQPLTVIAHNTGNQSASVAVSIQSRETSEDSDGDAIVLVRREEDDSLQSAVEFDEILPHSSSRAIFLVRVVNGEPGNTFRLDFYLNDNEDPAILTPVPVNPVFNRLRLFQSVVARALLLPPLANVVLPLSVFVICGLAQPFFLRKLKIEETIENARQGNATLGELVWMSLSAILWGFLMLFIVVTFLFLMIFIAGRLAGIFIWLAILVFLALLFLRFAW